MTAPAQFRLGQRPALDGLRAVAVGFVMLVHYAGSDPRLQPWVSGGFIGVEIFFVLSGFLITSLVLAEFEDTGGWDLRRFYRRRVFRLVPALYVMATVCALLGSVFTIRRFGGASEQPLAFVTAVTYVMNFVTEAIAFLPLWAVPLWSLCVEVHFYLVWPPLLVAAAKRGGAYTVWLALAVATASLAARVVTFATIGHPYQTVLTTSRLDGLALGGLVAICLHRGWRPGAALRYAGPAGLAGLFVLLAVGDPRSWLMVVIGYPLVDICTAAVLLHALDHRSATGQLLNLGALRRLGQWSYSLYLWHLPVIAVVALQVDSPRLRMVVAAGLSVLVAAASATFVESPLRRLGRAPRRRLASKALSLDQ